MEKSVLGCGHPQPRRDTRFNPFQPPPTPTSATERAVERGMEGATRCPCHHITQSYAGGTCNTIREAFSCVRGGRSTLTASQRPVDHSK